MRYFPGVVSREERTIEGLQASHAGGFGRGLRLDLCIACFPLVFVVLDLVVALG